MPPTAAYAGLAAFKSGAGAQTVLGLPWPTSADAGARRFRARTGSKSYAAEAAFAAAELAVRVARANGTVTLSVMALGTWSSDLYDYVGTPAPPHESSKRTPARCVAASSACVLMSNGTPL
ncbi:MAG: hypothetical protein Q8K63_03540 [Acidimicrobiales bacterium]|nr:hypothetical protein [Acidimicrobiales bacterium]